MIVCEVGLNHQGNEEYSYEYIDHLSNTSCDAITYQIREKDFYLSEEYGHIRLPFSHYQSLVNKCHDNKKAFGIALANHELIAQCENINVDFYKVLSWDLNSYDFIDKLLETNKAVFVSTGMSSIEEIDKFCERYKNNKFASKNLRLIHTQLSFDIHEVNLKAIPFMQERYPYPVAFGNHCEDLNVLYASVAFEPSDTFMYVKHKEEVSHIDEKHSVRLSSLTKMIDSLTGLSYSLGTATKLKIEKKDKYLIQN